MTTAQLANRIIAKLGGDRVTFVRIAEPELLHQTASSIFVSKAYIVFDYAHYRYIVEAGDPIRVRQLEHNSELYQLENDYSKSIEGVLNGKE